MGVSWRFWRADLAWWLVGCWVVWAVLRLTGADRAPGVGPVLVPFIAFLPYVAATAIIPVGYAVLRRRWPAAGVSALVAITLLALVAPRAVADGDRGPGGDGGGDGARARGPVLRVLTVNLLVGDADPDAVVELARRTRADLVSAQELTPAAVAALKAAGLDALLPYRVLESRPGPAGTGLYARYPLRSRGVVRGRGPGGFAMSRAELVPPARSVPAAQATVEVVAVHPRPPFTPARAQQWERDLRALPLPAARPVRILVGDFNATLDHARMRALLDSGYRDAAAAAGQGLVPTFGGSLTRPPITIDHVLVDSRVAVRAVTVLPLPGSDHRAVAATVRLP